MEQTYQTHAKDNENTHPGPTVYYRPTEYGWTRQQPADIRARADEATITLGCIFIDAVALYVIAEPHVFKPENGCMGPPIYGWLSFR